MRRSGSIIKVDETRLRSGKDLERLCEWTWFGERGLSYLRTVSIEG